MAERNSILPAAWNALVQALCQQTPCFQATLAPEIDRFSQQRLASGWLSAAFNTSLLACNGCPLEFTVSTLKPLALSCTLDPFLPSCTEECDIGAFIRYYQQIVVCSPPLITEADFEAVNKIQSHSAHPLRFGSWLGRKYTPDGVETKVYSEVHSEDLDPAHWPGTVGRYSASACREAGLSLMMVGYYPHQPASSREYYLQWHSALITWDDIAAVMRFFACESLQPALKTLLEQALQQTVNGNTFPPTTYGFSLVCDRQGTPESVTLFAMAASFFGGNPRVFPAVEALLRQNDFALPLLQKVMDADIPVQFNCGGLYR